MQIYVHRSGADRTVRMELRDVDKSASVAEALGLSGGESVWLEEGQDPVDHTAALSATGIGDRDHVHVNTCRKVSVTVTYNNDPRTRDFPPATTILAVFAWATGPNGFNLSKEDQAEVALQVCGTDEQPEHSDHVGSFVAVDTCDVCLELVHKQVIQG